MVNEHNHIIATGYNGVPAKFTHCTDHPCPGSEQPSGQGLELCEAIHAEQNALIQCRDVYSIMSAYCTDSPCVHCVKMLLNTSCRRIVFLREYSHNSLARDLWLRARETHGRREWVPLSVASQVTGCQV